MIQEKTNTPAFAGCGDLAPFDGAGAAKACFDCSACFVNAFISASFFCSSATSASLRACSSVAKRF